MNLKEAQATSTYSNSWKVHKISSLLPLGHPPSPSTQHSNSHDNKVSLPLEYLLIQLRII